jgi:hypothetical protein
MPSDRSQRIFHHDNASTLGQVDASDAALAELIEKYAEGWAYNIA